jgi:hypothetical protein
MAWVYWTFNGVMLPRYNAVADLSTPTAQGSIVPSLGGLYDYVGSADRAMTAVHQCEVSGILAGAGFNDIFDPGLWATETGQFVVTAPSQGSRPILFIDQGAQAEGEYNLLKAQWGKRGPLVIRDPVTGVTKSRTARLLRVRRIQEQKHSTGLIECSCLFETLTQDWT